jgi:hypothetical protein
VRPGRAGGIAGLAVNGIECLPVGFVEGVGIESQA